MNKDLDSKIIAGGGIKSGLDIAKAIVLGADYASCAIALLKAANNNPDEVVEILEQFKLELQVAMFAAGVTNISQLKNNYKLIQMNCD